MLKKRLVRILLMLVDCSYTSLDFRECVFYLLIQSIKWWLLLVIWLVIVNWLLSKTTRSVVPNTKFAKLFIKSSKPEVDHDVSVNLFKVLSEFNVSIENHEGVLVFIVKEVFVDISHILKSIQTGLEVFNILLLTKKSKYVIIGNGGFMQLNKGYYLILKGF